MASGALTQTLVQAAATRTRECLERLTDEEWACQSIEEADREAARLGFAEAPAIASVALTWRGAVAVLTLPEAEAWEFAKAYLFKKVEPGDDFLDRTAELMGSLGEAALAELGNVVVNACVAPWADARGQRLILSTPAFTRGDRSAVQSWLGERAARIVGPIQAIVMRFRCARLEIRCELRSLLGPAALAGSPSGAGGR